MDLQVGFGFRPSEDELVGYYLRHKIDGNNWLVEGAINEVNICDFDPWNLRFQSKYHSTDPVWYFFSRRDNTYGTETRQNRQTSSGKWKLTGDAVDVKDQWGRWCGVPKTKIGYKRNLVFIGNKSFTKKSDWIMHEFYYSLVPSQLQRTYVICRLEYKGDDANVPFDNLTDHTPIFVPNPSEGFVMNQSLQGNANPDYNTGIQGQMFDENLNMDPLQGNLGFLNAFSVPWQIEENFNMQLLHEHHDTTNYLPWSTDFYNYEQPVSYAAGTCDDETHIIRNYLRETLAEEKEIH